MKCEICRRDVKPIVHYKGVDRCLKCDKKNDIKMEELK